MEDSLLAFRAEWRFDKISCFGWTFHGFGLVWGLGAAWGLLSAGGPPGLGFEANRDPTLYEWGVLMNEFFRPNSCTHMEHHGAPKESLKDTPTSSATLVSVSF